MSPLGINLGVLADISNVSIPEADLWMYLDPGNPLSYSGTGEEWSDLSPLGNDAILVNDPIYSSANGGIFNFNGIDQEARVPVVNAKPTTGITIIYFINSTFSQINISGFGNYLSSGNRGYLVGVNSADTLRFFLPTSASTSILVGGTFAVSGWAMIHARHSPSTFIDVGINGVQQFVNTIGVPSTAYDNLAQFRIADRGDSGNEVACDIGPVLVYSRSLSDDELMQIYDAFSPRYL